jgi:Putative adipose-regulatory protein (Seipin)
MSTLIAAQYNAIQQWLQKSRVVYRIKRLIFPVIIGSLVLSALLGSSTIAYLVFYWTYIPSVAITRDVYLQFKYSNCLSLFTHVVEGPRPGQEWIWHTAAC